MDVVYPAIVAVHIVSGLTGLCLFWVPALTRKGGPLHRRAGRAYVWAMGFTGGSGTILATVLLVRGEWVFATFLMYLAVILFTAAWEGLQALRIKDNPRGYRAPFNYVLIALNLAMGAALLALGLVHGVTLFVALSPIGLLIGGGRLLSYLQRPPAYARWWWNEHLGGMIGSGIGAHVAFFAFGARRLWPEASQYVGAGVWAWVTPVVVGTLAIFVLQAYYERKFKGAVS